jgi:cytochrome d ubiquinol oxidase subunit I
VDVVELSRLQFALTVGFHFIFPSVTIGLAGLIAIVETLRWRTGDNMYDRLSVFMTKLFAVTFVIGIVSGIVMEFQFGTNWSRFATFVGDIFGAPLAAEGIFAFFLESAFVGIVLFGRNRVSSTVRWVAALLVMFGTLMSAFWILAANSWQHTPAGYRIVTQNGVDKAEMVDFWGAMFNPSTLPRFFHTVSACYVVGAFFLMGIAAWYVLRGRHLDVSRFALRLGMIVAALGSVLMFVSGDIQTREVATNQPAKFAAMEGVFETSRGVDMTILSLPPSQTGPADGPAVVISKGLSFLSTGDPNGEIRGLNETDPSLWPPVMMTFVGFHTMMGIGILLLLLMIFGSYYLWRGQIEIHTTWLRFAVLAIPLPILAVEFGWMTTEVGRQPWLVQGLLKTVDGVSPGISAGDVWVSLWSVVVLYVLLALLWLYTLGKEIAHGPDPAPGQLVVARVAGAVAAAAKTAIEAKAAAPSKPAAPAKTAVAARPAAPARAAGAAASAVSRTAAAARAALSRKPSAPKPAAPKPAAPKPAGPPAAPPPATPGQATKAPKNQGGH